MRQAARKRPVDILLRGDVPTRACNEQCLWFGKHVLVFVVLFGVWFLNALRVVFGLDHTRIAMA